MSKTAEAEINASEVTRAWQRFRNPKGENGPPFELGGLDQHGLAAAFIVAMLGPKLDAIQSVLVEIRDGVTSSGTGGRGNEDDVVADIIQPPDEVRGDDVE